MWMQVVGKVALAQAPPLNHSWAVALQMTPRGLSTRPLPYGPRVFTMEFNFLTHHLTIETSDGATRALPLAPRTVADFYRNVMALLADMGLPVRIWSMPVEVPSPIRFEDDTAHRSYDPAYAQRVWRILSRLELLLTARRSPFVGKASPAHFFWGGFDLALSRFSGRLAPAREGPAFMREAYSHEVISHGFWPGSGAVPEPAFYAYAAPEPAGFRSAAVEPAGAYYSQDLSEFILPYEAVRTADRPASVLTAFVESTYAAAADLAAWDRDGLERRTSAR
jgi:hypothetical protein